MVRASAWVVPFLVTAAVGAVIWLVSEAALPEWLIGQRRAYDLAHSFLFDFFGFPAFAFVAGIVGFIFRKGFWLWGIAIALPVPAIDAIQTRSLIDQGLIESSSLAETAFVTVVTSIEIAFVCTVTSAVGASLRLLAKRMWERSGSTEGS